MNERQVARRVAKVLTRLSALWRMPEQINQMRSDLMAREQENYAQLQSTIGEVKTAFTSQRTEIEQLRAALEQADADKLRAVDEALAADSEHDADAIAAVDASLRELVPGQPVEVPAEGGDTGGDVPADQPADQPADEAPASADPDAAQ